MGSQGERVSLGIMLLAMRNTCSFAVEAVSASLLKWGSAVLPPKREVCGGFATSGLLRVIRGRSPPVVSGDSPRRFTAANCEQVMASLNILVIPGDHRGGFAI